MIISRQDVLKELLPGLNALFDMEYNSHARKRRIQIGGNDAIHGLTPIHHKFSKVDGDDQEIST